MAWARCCCSEPVPLNLFLPFSLYSRCSIFFFLDSGWNIYHFFFPLFVSFFFFRNHDVFSAQYPTFIPVLLFSRVFVTTSVFFFFFFVFERVFLPCYAWRCLCGCIGIWIYESFFFFPIYISRQACFGVKSKDYFLVLDLPFEFSVLQCQVRLDALRSWEADTAGSFFFFFSCPSFAWAVQAPSLLLFVVLFSPFLFWFFSSPLLTFSQ